MANGLRVILAENHTVPLVVLTWTAQAGFESDPPGLEGLASLTPLLLGDGTVHRSASRITRDLDDLGADLAAGADWDSAFLNLGLLSRDLAAGAELLLDMACAPRFPDAAVTRARQRRLAEIERRRRDPGTRAGDELARVLFGDTVYGRASFGTSASVQRIGAADLVAFHAAHYRPATSYLVVAGSFDPAHAADVLGSFDLPPTDQRTPPLPRPFVPPAEAPGGIRLVDLRHARRTEIRVGHAGVARDSEHLPALEVLNVILGGGPASRLACSLRQHEGLTYQVRSRFAARRLGGTFVVETSVAHEGARAALAGIHREIDRLCSERVPAADVERARQRLFGAELRRFQDLIGTGVVLGPAALHHDPEDFLERRRQRIAAVEPDALRELARRYLDPARLVTVIVGPADALRSHFSSNGADRCRPALESTS